MMNLPHLSFLRSFEAAARHLSFTSAAEELNCTQSAVSNHVRSLEEFLKRPLFVRHPRSLSLTDVGKAYLPSVRHALQEIDVATQSLVLRPHTRTVVVSCPVSLAANWLPDVIRGFSENHPDISVTVHGTIWTDVDPNVSDISITINHRDDASESLTRLWAEKLTVVCAPGYTVGDQPLTDPQQLHDAQLIHILGRSAYWEKVAANFGLEDLDQKEGPRSNSSNLALELAAKSLGCVALPKSLARPYVERGLLIEPFALNLDSPWAYYANLREANATPAVRLFQNWLLKVAAETEGQIG
ncbi:MULTISPECIES: LysR substrate-binding domain-containing protein [unclassified Ruegeria]|uniref:LysR substrate-binding domain-containing protein n=1 Tax=unclassified Ruegeria TaxID=2625375 RepID=UPI0014888B82|nr:MULTISPECIES: LysR substrate-binding domain-containing protein [unclassified Ruegeria]NOD64620.1 LysR family transcriptional regulator [Ruegeria sp. HKCCD6109]